MLSIGHNSMNGTCGLKNDSNIEIQHCDPLLSSSNPQNQTQHPANGIQNHLHHHHHHHHHHSTTQMDIGSCIADSILGSTHNLLSTSPHRSHVDSILSSPDTDSLVSDIDMAMT